MREGNSLCWSRMSADLERSGIGLQLLQTQSEFLWGKDILQKQMGYDQALKAFLSGSFAECAQPNTRKPSGMPEQNQLSATMIAPPSFHHHNRQPSPLDTIVSDLDRLRNSQHAKNQSEKPNCGTQIKI